MTEYEMKLLLEALEKNSKRLEEAIKGTTFNLARIHNKLESIEELFRESLKNDNQRNDRSGLIK